MQELGRARRHLVLLVGLSLCIGALGAPPLGALPVGQPATGTGTGTGSAVPTRQATMAAGAGSPVVVAVTGSDTSGCGAPSSPCGTLSYAVNSVANGLQPLEAMVTVSMGPGWYSGACCGPQATRPLQVTGARPECTCGVPHCSELVVLSPLHLGVT